MPPEWRQISKNPLTLSFAFVVYLQAVECGTVLVLCKLGIQIRNMKMGFNIYGTCRPVTFEKLMMKIYDFFYSAKSFSHPV